MTTEKIRTLAASYACAYAEDEIAKCADISHLIYDDLLNTATQQVESEWCFFIVEWMRMRFDLIESVKNDIGPDVAKHLLYDLRDNDEFRLDADLSPDHIKQILEVAIREEEYEFAAYLREELQWVE